MVPSSAPLFSPHYFWANVPPTAVQQQLRVAFTRWGLPSCLRVDNGKPWGSWSDLPPALALWVIGLGIDMLWNDPCCQGERTTNPLADKDLRQSLGKEIVKDEVAPFMTIRCHFVTYQCHLACF